MNFVLAVVALFFAFSLIRNLTYARSLPPPPGPRQAPAALPVAEQTTESAIARETLATYNVIPVKHLINPGRSESNATVAAAPPAPPPPKPLLMGLVVDGPESRAYLEDPTTKRVLSYRIGDTVSGGRLDKITDDKVVIVRPDGPIDVMLRDPAKPKPPAPPPTAANAPPTGALPAPGGAAPTPGAGTPSPPTGTPLSPIFRSPSAVAAPPAAPTTPAGAGSQSDNTAVGRGRGGGRR